MQRGPLRLAARAAGLSLSFFAVPAAGQTIALEQYLGAPESLAYSGTFELDSAAGDISGAVYRHGTMQRLEGWAGLIPIWVLIDVTEGTAAVASPVSQSYITLPLSAPTVRDYIPDPRTHTDVEITRAIDRDEEDGLTVEVHQLTGQTIDGTAYVAEITQSTDGVIIEVEGETEMGDEFEFELGSHQLGDVDPALFEVPAGFQPAPNLQAVLTPRAASVPAPQPDPEAEPGPSPAPGK